MFSLFFFMLSDSSSSGLNIQHVFKAYESVCLAFGDSITGSVASRVDIPFYVCAILDSMFQSIPLSASSGAPDTLTATTGGGGGVDVRDVSILVLGSNGFSPLMSVLTKLAFNHNDGNVGLSSVPRLTRISNFLFLTLHYSTRCVCCNIFILYLNFLCFIYHT